MSKGTRVSKLNVTIYIFVDFGSAVATLSFCAPLAYVVSDLGRTIVSLANLNSMELVHPVASHIRPKQRELK
jgi:hypothetical protein